MATAPRLMTAEELSQLPDDGQRHELIAGELRSMTPGGEEHGEIAATLITLLRVHVYAHRLGRVVASETGFRLAADPDTVRAPDAAFISQARVREAGRVRGYRWGSPDLVVEVVSPHDRSTEVEETVALWLKHGAWMVIVVNPATRTVAVHRSSTVARHLTTGDILDGEEVVPGWTLPVRDLFPDLDNG